jgi:iron complex transport system ATP-binding protein
VSGTRVLLSARDLSVQLRDKPVLHNVSLEVRVGLWTAIVGPNGAGKSTLLRAMSGLLPSDARHTGEVAALDRAQASWARNEWAQHCSWFSSAETASLDLSVQDAVSLSRLAHHGWLGSPGAADRAAVAQALARCEVEHLATRRLGELSSGERQRALLARALAVEARCVLMDEPLAHLDAPHQAQWIATARMLATQGHAVVSVLHELQVALQADWLVLMDAGRVIAQGATHDPDLHAQLVALFDGRISVHRIDTADGPQWAVLSG